MNSLIAKNAYNLRNTAPHHGNTKHKAIAHTGPPKTYLTTLNFVCFYKTWLPICCLIVSWVVLGPNYSRNLKKLLRCRCKLLGNIQVAGFCRLHTNIACGAVDLVGQQPRWQRVTFCVLRLTLFIWWQLLLTYHFVRNSVLLTLKGRTCCICF